MDDPKKYDILKIDPRDMDGPVYVVVESLLPDEMLAGNSGDTWQHDYDVAGEPDRIFRNFHLLVNDEGEFNGPIFEYLRTIEQPEFERHPGSYNLGAWRAIIPEAFEPRKPDYTRDEIEAMMMWAAKETDDCRPDEADRRTRFIHLTGMLAALSKLRLERENQP